MNDLVSSVRVEDDNNLKVKIGGTLGGDDMNWKGVRRAVEDTLTNFEDHGRYWTYKNETF